MTAYSGLTDRQVEWLTTQLQHDSFYRTQVYSYFNGHGLIDSVGLGAKEVNTVIMEKMEPGRISFSLHDLPDSYIEQRNISTQAAIIGTVITLNKQEVDAWINNNASGLNVGPMMPAAVSEQLERLFQQVDAFLAVGSNMPTALQRDVGAFEGSTQFTGILNGFTANSAGAGSDNNVTAAGDFVATVDDYIVALKNDGWDSDGYFIFSDLTTWQAAAAGNNFATGSLTSERDRIIQRADIKAWFASPAMLDGSSARKIAVTSPMRSLTARTATPRTRPYALKQTYPFTVQPLYGGGFNRQLQTQMAVFWGGVLEETHPTALQRSGSLT